jgi:hypothetical protein
MPAKGSAEWKGDVPSGTGTFTAGDTISGGYTAARYELTKLFARCAFARQDCGAGEGLVREMANPGSVGVSFNVVQRALEVEEVTGLDLGLSDRAHVSLASNKRFMALAASAL